VRIDSVVAACEHLGRYFKPDYKERFPVPATIREQAYVYRKEQQERAQAQELQTRALLPVAAAPDAEALANIRDIITMLDEKMAMQNAKKASTAARREERKAELFAQAQQILAEDQARKEREYAE
jgi:hypothetical protein